MTYKLARAKAEADFNKFLERDCAEESEWLAAAVSYLRTITKGLESDFLPSSSIDPDCCLQSFYAGIDSAITYLWNKEFSAQAFVREFNYGHDGEEWAFKNNVRTPELETLWKQKVTDFWLRHAAYLEQCERSEVNPNGATEPKPDEPTGKIGGLAARTADKGGADRRAAVDAYIEEVFNRTGKRITRTDIWKAARYKTRTEFERWERNDPRATKTADQRFIRILTEKPHLK